ncbi:ABC transporter permease subunit [Dehalococcoidia bacterium]|nr:ABC transporter permease subunit [Dehalococcoidia bacterium]MCL0075939.1 ABC transporter permease subunit [Dehalococcoidia bacterium]
MKAMPTSGAIFLQEKIIPVLKKRIVPALTLALAAPGLLLGCLSLSLNCLEAYPVPLLGLLSCSLLGLLLYARRLDGRWDPKLIILFAFAVISTVLLASLPEHLYGFQINAIVHRSLVSAILLLAIALPATCFSLYYLLGATPRAHDLSRYPLIVLPVLLILIAYALLIFHLIKEGAPNLNWEIISVPWIGSDWTTVPIQSVNQPGLRNHILGTLLLMALTSLISLPIGVAAGVLMSEYYGKWLAGVVRFSVTSLRAMSVLILGLTAVSLVAGSRGRFFEEIMHGYWYNLRGVQRLEDGSFPAAAIVLSLLVIPVIAWATERGIRSLPPDLREGSLALGRSEEYTLARIVLPWALPNIITGLLLGCAEAAGSVAVIMFLAGRGEHGVGPLSEVTSLAYFIYDVGIGTAGFEDTMRPYRFSAALLLVIITTALGIAALILKRKFAQRYRGE